MRDGRKVHTDRWLVLQKLGKLCDITILDRCLNKCLFYYVIIHVQINTVLAALYRLQTILR